MLGLGGKQIDRHREQTREIEDPLRRLQVRNTPARLTPGGQEQRARGQAEEMLHYRDRPEILKDRKEPVNQARIEEVAIVGVLETVPVSA